MLEEQFKNFERVITIDLEQRMPRFSIPDPDYIQSNIATLREDAKVILMHVMSVNTEKKKRRWTINSRYQQRIEIFLNILNRIRVDKFEISFDAVVTSPISWHGFIEEIAMILAELLDHILVKYWKRCDQGGLLPEYLVKFFCLNKPEMFRKELAVLNEGTQCYEALSFVSLALDDWEDDLSSFQFHYFDKLLKRVKKILKEEDTDEIKAEKIHSLLWKMNFNHSAYAEFIAQRLREGFKDLNVNKQISEYEHIEGQISRIKHHREDKLYFKSGSLKRKVRILLWGLTSYTSSSCPSPQRSTPPQ